jgi:hypothetical protein
MNYGYLAYLFVLAYVGHRIGDFWLQPKNWALRKSEKSWFGFFICTLHVVVYTFAVCVLLKTYNLYVVASIFIPHWLIDRYSFANTWLGWIHGRTFMGAFNSKDKFREFDIAFTSLVYGETDGSFHHACLWLTIYFLHPYL